jgi:peptide/nickel transport system ATP-binding protein
MEKEPVNLIEVQDLKVWFPANKPLLGKPRQWIKAVDGVSMVIRKGETLGLVGESGCGKTTLGRAILRLVDSVEGKIIFRGRDITRLDSQALKPLRKEMQIIFQDPFSSLNPRIPVGTAIMEAMGVHGIGSNRRNREEKTVELLGKVGLSADHLRRYPHEFSGGQRQRIGIARALALDPDFLVCDESVSALDVSVQAQVLNLLSDLRKEFGFTILFISHDLAVVHYLSDRILVMNKGRIEEEGTAGDIFHNPRSPYTRKLIEAIPGKSRQAP